MNIFEKCHIWQQNGEFGKIIEAVNQVPRELRAPILEIYLANALCAISEGWEDRDRLRDVIAICMSHQDTLQNNFFCNFDLAYALSQLGMDTQAIPYFEKAAKLERVPGQMQGYIDKCRQYQQLPLPKVPFPQRVKMAWNIFLRNQPIMLKIMEGPMTSIKQAEIIRLIYEFLYTAFNEMGMSISGDFNRLQIIMSPQGSATKLYAADYFLKHKPESVSEKFLFTLGTPPHPHQELELPDWIVRKDQISTWLEKLDEGQFNVYLFNEDLKKHLPADKRLANMVLDQILYAAIGEIPAIRYLREIKLVDSPRSETPIMLSDLADHFKALGLNLDTDPNLILQDPISYAEPPDQTKDAIIRADIEKGTTRCIQLIRNYADANSENVDLIQADGATAGFFMFFLDPFTGPNKEEEIKQFEEELIKAVTDRTGKDSWEVVGNAVGTKAGYIDFIAWDLGAVLDAAKKYLGEAKKAHVGFHVFRREGDVTGLYDGPIGEKKDAPENPGAGS